MEQQQHHIISHYLTLGQNKQVPCLQRHHFCDEAASAEDLRSYREACPSDDQLHYQCPVYDQQLALKPCVGHSKKITVS